MCRRQGLRSHGGAHVPVRAAVKITQAKGFVKFKVRCSRYLYTVLVKNEGDKVEKLRDALPPGLDIEDLRRK